jgi:hypothetical protein
MKRALLFFYGAMISSFLNGQVTIQNNMPLVIEPNTETTVEVKINKGAISNFIKYQIDLPAGVVVNEGDSKGGTFAFESNRVKIIWPVAPADPEIVITMKLVPGSFAGPAKITQKFYYMEEGTKKEIDAEPLNITFNGSGVQNTSNIGALDPPAKTTTATPQQADKLQAEQLKKDSKDAYQTGLKEKESAEKKLAEADEALKNAETIQNEEEKKAALEKASAKKQKAETDKAVASKILMLAKSLDDNANEIERLNKSAATSTANSTAAAPVVSDNGTVYRLQLGAFTQNPEKILYKHLGSINIVNENGMYKVLMGKYATREDALKRREELIARSFDCFIVTYKDGVRVK